MKIPNDTLLFCPFDGKKIIIAEDKARCPIHGYIEGITEVWREDTVVISYDFRGSMLRFTDEKAIVQLMGTEPVADDFDTSIKIPAENGGNWDQITKPSHYNQYSGFEVMDVCRQLVSPDATPASTWYRGNVFKYLARAGWKSGDSKELQDLEKAGEYLRKEMERVKTRDDFLAENEKKDENVEAMREYLKGVNTPDQFSEEMVGLHGVKNMRWGNVKRTANDDGWFEAGADPTPSIDITRCPECGIRLVRKKFVALKCPNKHGFVLVKGKTEKWVSAPTLNPKADPDESLKTKIALVDEGGLMSRVVTYRTIDNPDWCGASDCIQHPQTVDIEVP